MTELLQCAEAHIFCIAVLIIIAWDIKQSEFNHGMRPTLLLKYIGFVCAFYLLDILNEIPHEGFFGFSNTTAYVFISAYFMFFTASTYYWFSYSEIIHDREHLTNTKWRLITAIPVFALLILFVVSYFNGALFSIDSNGAYHRGPLGFIQSVVSFGYIMASVFRCLYFIPKAVGTEKKRDLINFAAWSVAFIVFGAAQFFSGGLSVLVGGNTILVLITYLDYTGKLISNDPLTGIPNKRKLLHYLSEETNQLKADEELWFMFIDIDHFKQINDRYGHDEGDRILKEFTIAVKEFCRKKGCFCARFGGDEFVLVKKLKETQAFVVPDELKKFVEEKNILVNNEHRLTASMGYTKFNRSDYTVNEMIKRADKEMYNAKMARAAALSED